MAEEALFMNAYSLYLDAPDYNLDQQSSQEAVAAIQQFVTRFPGSASYERAMEMLGDLELRFEEKAYQMHPLKMSQKNQNNELAPKTFRFPLRVSEE